MQRVNVELIDDLDAETAAVETVRFSVDGTRYEIDLNAEHYSEFQQVLERFTAAARATGPGRKVSRPAAKKTTRATVDREQLTAMRQWGRDHGFELSDKGRVPVAVQEAYHAAQAKPKRATRKR